MTSLIVKFIIVVQFFPEKGKISIRVERLIRFVGMNDTYHFVGWGESWQMSTRLISWKPLNALLVTRGARLAATRIWDSVLATSDLCYLGPELVAGN